MKNHKVIPDRWPYKGLVFFIMLLGACTAGGNLQAQDEEIPVQQVRPVKNTFESIWLMDNQTIMVPIKGTFEMDFQHRFGTWDKGYDDFYGVFAPSNIRMGFGYVPMQNILIGFGFTKMDLLWDFYGKYALIRQAQEGGSPVSVSYYVNAAIDTRKEEKTLFEEATDRWSFFHQIMVARKMSNNLSIQVAGNLSWFNFKNPVFDDEGTHLGRDRNLHFSASGMARYKVSNTMGLTLGYDLPITDQKFFNPEPNLSLGFEVVTSSHAFQLFVGNYKSLVPQYNHSFNPNSFGDNQILLGFNITRLWNF